MRHATLVEKARPNGHYVGLWAGDSGEWWAVEEQSDEDEEPYEFEFESLAEAKAHFDTSCAELRVKPNWEAQARYDEAHGTDNGYALWQHRREE